MSRAEYELTQARRRRGAAWRLATGSCAGGHSHAHPGLNATTLDDVRIASGTSKSQLYSHFADKESLVQEVISLQAHEVLARQRQRLERLDSIRGLELWRDDVVRRNALRNGAYGCEIGSLASELSDQDEAARIS